MKLSNGLRVVIVNGRPESGKTTFENLCEDILGKAFCEKRSTVDKIKAIAKMGGWDGEKTPEARKLLSDLKDIFTKFNDMPFNDIIKYLSSWESDLSYYGVSDHPHVLFVDAREPEQIEKLKKELNGIAILIERTNSIVISNHADNNVYNYKNYDWTIDNNGTLEDLKEQASIFLNSIFS